MNVTRTTALVAASALLAAPAVALLGGPAAADGPERHARGTLAGAPYDISLEKERGRFEVSADVDGATRGSTWKVVVRHDGRLVGKDTARALPDDGAYDVDFRELRSADTPGADRFKVTLIRVGGDRVTRTLTLR